MKKLLPLLLCAALLAACTGAVCAANTADASEPVDVTRTDCTLTVSYAAAASCGVTLDVKLHQISLLSADIQYTLCSPYPPVELNDLTTQVEWAAVCDTLTAYISADRIEPLQTVRTDALGQAHFSGLCPGLYYVEGCTFVSGRTTYTYAPFLVTVPELQPDGTWNYDALAVPKHTETSDPMPGPEPEPKPDEKEYTVVKVWKTASGASHAESVEIELYRDGTLAQTLTLSAENNWTYTWTDDTDAVWLAVERNVPDGCTVSVSGERVITIVNSVNDEVPTPVTPDLPYTGDTQTILPYVLLLAAGGIGLIVLALLGLKKKHE